MAVGGFFPLRRQVPVIGDVVVVEDHQARQVCQHPGNPAKAAGKAVDQLLFLAIARLALGAEAGRHLRLDQAPGHR
ncbi:hypothetical protein D3C85_1726010 [compost metagenome]